MSFSKAEQLIELATMVAGRRTGVLLEDVTERFGVAKRTAQRMLRALETRFPDTEATYDDEGRKRWRLPSGALRELLTINADELTALDLAIEALQLSGHSSAETDLAALREKVLALVPRSKAARLETDHEALLEAQGFVARPGPRPVSRPDVDQTIAEAIKACRMVDIVYRSLRDEAPRQRCVAPYGFLAGIRRYVVARPVDDMSGPVRTFRLDGIHSASLADGYFERPPEFSLQAFANRAFGMFQSASEYGEVVWRFTPEAADHARAFVFHPEQVLEDQADGSLLVRFFAAGHLEMCWYLYCWGDKVEVVKPEALRRLVAGHQRPDFPALP